jgi:hypothetical protein
MRQLFELWQPTETDLYGFKVTLVAGGRDTVLTPTKRRRTLYDIFTATFNKYWLRYLPGVNCPHYPIVIMKKYPLHISEMVDIWYVRNT